MKSVNAVVLSGLMLSTCAHAAPACRVGDMSLKLDDGNGEFNGMSQSGTMLVMRNTGKVTCTLGVLPEVVFDDADHHLLSAERRVPRGMHPGPVLMPVQLRVGKEATSRLHWVASDVFDGGHCIRPARLSVSLEGRSLHVPFGRMMCAPAGSDAYFDQQPFQPAG